MTDLIHRGQTLLQDLDGFSIEVDEKRERADIILHRPPLNVISMHARDQLRAAFEALDEQTIRRELEPVLRRRVHIESCWRIDSTNSALLRAAADGAQDFSVLVAETQSEGRGRRRAVKHLNRTPAVRRPPGSLRDQLDSP